MLAGRSEKYQEVVLKKTDIMNRYDFAPCFISSYQSIIYLSIPPLKLVHAGSYSKTARPSLETCYFNNYKLMTPTGLILPISFTAMTAAHELENQQRLLNIRKAETKAMKSATNVKVQDT